VWIICTGHRSWPLLVYGLPLIGEGAYLLYDLGERWRDRIPATGEIVVARLHMMNRGPRLIRPGERLRVVEVLSDGRLTVRSAGGATARLYPYEVVPSTEDFELAS
ncbi:MAG: hypothetical protein ACRDM0_26380, partial [Thermoleophilaceae bacterium]